MGMIPIPVPIPRKNGIITPLVLLGFIDAVPILFLFPDQTSRLRAGGVHPGGRRVVGEGVRPARVPWGLREGGGAAALDQETRQVREQQGGEVNRIPLII